MLVLNFNIMRTKFIIFVSLLLSAALQSLAQQNVYWRAEAANGNWENGNCDEIGNVNSQWWYPGFAPNSARNRPDCFDGNTTRHDLEIGNNDYLNMTINTTFWGIRSLTLTANATSQRTFTGNPDNNTRGIGLTNGIYNNSPANHEFNTFIGIDASPVYLKTSNSNATTAYNREIYGNGNAIVFQGGGNTSVSAVISGNGTSLTKEDGGTLTLTGACSYTGTTTITGGTLRLNRSGGNTLPSSNNVVINGGTLRIQTNQTLNNLTISSGNLIVDAGVVLTINGTFSGGGTIQNDGTIELKGSTAFPGSSASITAMNDVIINSTSGVTLDKNLTIQGDLTLTNGLLSLGNFDLIVNGQVLGGGSNSYVRTNGTGVFKPRVNTGGAITYHVGNNGVYTPIVLNFTDANFGSDSRLVFSTSTGVPVALNSANTYYLNRTWVIEAEDITDFQYNIEFTYDDGELTLGTDEDQLMPVKFSNNVWYRPIGSSFSDGIEQGTASVDPVNNTITWSQLTTFSQFTVVQNSPGPLPVTITSFNASCQGSQVVLTWSTASELNASHFNVQMSRDGLNWNTVGKVEAAGTTVLTTEYQFKTPNSGALTYYRLSQVDLDGATEIFGPVSSFCDLKQNVVAVFPNPAGDYFSIDIRATEASAQATVQLLDLMGKVVFTQDLALVEGSNQVRVSDATILSGTYLVRVIAENQSFETVRLLVK